MDHQELRGKLGFHVVKTTIPASNGRPAQDRVEVHHRTGIYVGDQAHWLMWELLRNGTNGRTSNPSS